MGHLKYKILTFNSYFLSLLLLVQCLFYYLITEHDLYHIGQSSILIIVFFIFLSGYLFNLTKSGSYFIYLMFPLLILTLVLKILWSGGIYSPFMPWLYLCSITFLFFEKKRFFKVLVFVCFVASHFSLLYFIKLNQMNFAHSLFKLTTINYLLCYLIPFLYLAIYFFINSISHKNLSFLQSLGTNWEEIPNVIKSVFNIKVSIEKLGNNRIKLISHHSEIFNDSIHEFMELIHFHLENHYENAEKLEFIYRSIKD